MYILIRIASALLRRKSYNRKSNRIFTIVSVVHRRLFAAMHFADNKINN